MLRHPALHENCRITRIHPCGQPVDHRVHGVLFNAFRCVVIGSQRMQVGHEEKALVFVLELNPVFQHTMQVAKM